MRHHPAALKAGALVQADGRLAGCRDPQNNLLETDGLAGLRDGRFHQANADAFPGMPGMDHHAVELGAVSQFLLRLAFQTDHADQFGADPGAHEKAAAERFTQAQSAQIAFGRAGTFTVEVGIKRIRVEAQRFITQVLVGTQVSRRDPRNAHGCVSFDHSVSPGC